MNYSYSVELDQNTKVAHQDSFVEKLGIACPKPAHESSLFVVPLVASTPMALLLMHAKNPEFGSDVVLSAESSLYCTHAFQEGSEAALSDHQLLCPSHSRPLPRHGPCLQLEWRHVPGCPLLDRHYRIGVLQPGLVPVVDHQQDLRR